MSLFKSFKTYWVTHEILNGIATLATTIFIDFFIWENTQSFPVLLKFNLGLFITYPLGVLLSSLLSEFLGLKITEIFTKLLQSIFVLLLILLGVGMIANSFHFGLLDGLIIGLAFSPSDLLTGKILPQDQLEVNSKIKAGSILIGLAFSPFFSILVDKTGSFNLPFIFAIVIYLVLLLSAFLIPFPQLDGNFNLLEVFKIPGNNPEKGILIKSSFIVGLKDSIQYSLIGVLTLDFIGNLTSWGWLKLGFSALSLLLIFIYKKLSFAKTSIISLGVGALIFLAGSVFFAYYLSLLGIIVYTLAITLFEVLYGFGLTGTMNKLTEIDVSKEDLSAEYTFLVSLFSSLGMIIPIFILDYFKVDLTDPLIFQMLIVFIGLLPFTILKTMSRSFHLTHQT